MKDVATLYEEYCNKKGVKFQLDDKVNPYDNTTLFCPAGMQQFKPKFKNPDNTTIANIQSCIRLNDLDEIGDGTHLLYFNMLGLFSFGELTINDAIKFWMDFVNGVLGIKVDKVTIHSDRFDTWKFLYEHYDIPVILDDECVWSDGEMGGYCTEFYHNGLEIGNIVNTMDKFVDVGFGMERLQAILDGDVVHSATETLQETIEKIIYSGYKPGPQKQGYVLRKLLRELYIRGGHLDHPFFEKEVERQEKARVRYLKLSEKPSNRTKSKEWWFDTHGIDLDEMKRLNQNKDE